MPSIRARDWQSYVVVSLNKGTPTRKHQTTFSPYYWGHQKGTPNFEKLQLLGTCMYAKDRAHSSCVLIGFRAQGLGFMVQGLGLRV